MELITTVAAATLIIFLLAAIINTAVEILVQQRINKILDIIDREDWQWNATKKWLWTNYAKPIHFTKYVRKTEPAAGLVH